MENPEYLPGTIVVREDQIEGNLWMAVRRMPPAVPSTPPDLIWLEIGTGEEVEYDDLVIDYVYFDADTCKTTPRRPEN